MAPSPVHRPLSIALLVVVVFLLASPRFLSEAQRVGAGGWRKLHGKNEEEELSLSTFKKQSGGGSRPVEKAAGGKKNNTLLLLNPKKSNSTSATVKKGLVVGSKSSSVSLLSSSSSKSTGNKTKTVGPKPPKASNSTAAAMGKALKAGPKRLNFSGKADKKLGDLLPRPVDANKKKKNGSNISGSQQKQAAADGKGRGSMKGTGKPRGLAKPTQILPWLDDGDYGGRSTSSLITEFRDLPTKFHSALVPDLHRISTTSKAYLTHANKELAKTFKPLVGTKYAPSAATAASATTVLLPLLLAGLLIRCLSPHLPLQMLLLSAHIYLATYFATLALINAVTGHEPLRFFYASSPRFYAATQVLQTLAYAMYLLLQLVHVAAGGRVLGALQLLVGVVVGLHYYTAVFHRAVVGEPPRTNWRVHAVYAVCFAGVCALARAERRKKAYVGEGGREDGKKS